MTQTELHEYAKPGARPSLDFRVDEALCTSCGLCAQDCPFGLIRLDPTRVEQSELCLRCQHCMAVCPTGALSIENRKPEDSLSLKGEDLPSLEEMVRLVRGRRSVRRYQEKDVDPSLIQRLLGAAAHAPTGVNAQALTFTVVDSRTRLARIREQVLAGLARCVEENRLPERLGFLGSAPAAFSAQGIDMIFRNAPHLLLVSAPVTAPCGAEDVCIALATFELLAASAGLGTVWCGMLKMALELAPELKPLLDLPTEGVHYYPLLFGLPAVKYTRTVQRDGAASIKRLS